MKFWKNISGNLKQFACNHSNGYAYQRIVQMTAKDDGSADFASLHGKDCCYNPIAFPPSMEVRCNLVGKCRSNCRGGAYRSDSLTLPQQLHSCEIFGLRINNENNQE